MQLSSLRDKVRSRTANRSSHNYGKISEHLTSTWEYGYGSDGEAYRNGLYISG